MNDRVALCRKAHKQRHVLPCLDSEEISLIRRLGAGGHALVFQGHINRGPPVALKVFASARNRRSCRVPVSNRICKDESHHTAAVSGLRLSISRAFAPREPLTISEYDVCRFSLGVAAGIEAVDANSDKDAFETDRRNSVEGSPALSGRMSMSPLQIMATVRGWFGMITSPEGSGSGGGSPSDSNTANVPAIKVAAVETPPKWPATVKYDGGKPAEEHICVANLRKSTARRMRDHEVAMMELIAPHPFVLRAIGHFSLPSDLPGLALDLCPMGALDSRITPDGRSPHACKSKFQWPQVSFNTHSLSLSASYSTCSTQIIEIFQHIADGMAHIHSLGLYHRDIKPSNFLIGSDDKGKVWNIKYP